jgi:hypothetical protein
MPNDFCHSTETMLSTSEAEDLSCFVLTDMVSRLLFYCW